MTKLLYLLQRGSVKRTENPRVGTLAGRVRFCPWPPFVKILQLKTVECILCTLIRTDSIATIGFYSARKKIQFEALLLFLAASVWKGRSLPRRLPIVSDA